VRRFLRTAAAFAAALLLLACAGSAAPKRARRAPPPAVPFQALVQRGIPGQAGEQIREVARDAASWHALWARLREGASPELLPEEPPTVDFNREMAIVAAMPTQSCVSAVTVRSVRRTPREVVVDLLEAPPAPNCVCIVSQRPIHAIRLPLMPEPVRFAVEHGQTSCGPSGR
jgi:hypothetical protein